MPLKIAVILALLLNFGLPCRQIFCQRVMICDTDAALSCAPALESPSCCSAKPAPVEQTCCGSAPVGLLCGPIDCPLSLNSDACPPCCKPCPPAEPAAPAGPGAPERTLTDRDPFEASPITLPPLVAVGQADAGPSVGSNCPRIVPVSLRRALLCVWTT